MTKVNIISSNQGINKSSNTADSYKKKLVLEQENMKLWIEGISEGIVKDFFQKILISSSKSRKADITEEIEPKISGELLFKMDSQMRKFLDFYKSSLSHCLQKKLSLEEAEGKLQDPNVRDNDKVLIAEYVRSLKEKLALPEIEQKELQKNEEREEVQNAILLSTKKLRRHIYNLIISGSLELPRDTEETCYTQNTSTHATVAITV